MIQQKRTRHTQPTIVNAKVARNINRAIVLNLIRARQPISRASISNITGLNKSTVSHIVSMLVEEHLVEEELESNREIGRNPLNLRILSGRHFVGAMYFETARTQIAVADIGGAIRNKIEIETESARPKEFLKRCLRQLKILGDGVRMFQLKRLGITVAGIVDAHRANVVYAPNLGWENVELGSMVRELEPTIEEVAVENDAKACALAELLLGKHRSLSGSLVFLSVGYGIGAGVVLDNRILGGNSHAAGEFGHMTIVEGGEPCSCGNAGCWEVYASDRATVRRYAQGKGIMEDEAVQVCMQRIVSAANGGDPRAQRELRTTGEYLGRGIANIIRSFDPELIIIGGMVTQAWNTVYPEIMAAVNRRGFFGKERNATILPTSLLDSPPLLGAAALSIRSIFEDHRINL